MTFAETLEARRLRVRYQSHRDRREGVPDAWEEIPFGWSVIFQHQGMQGIVAYRPQLNVDGVARRWKSLHVHCPER